MEEQKMGPGSRNKPGNGRQEPKLERTCSRAMEPSVRGSLCWVFFLGASISFHVQFDC